MPVLRVSDEVADAVARSRPVVALESTITAHGLPRPDNLRVGRAVEADVRAEGAVPAAVGVVGGIPTVGLGDAGLRRLAEADDVAKLAVRDLPLAVARRIDGATTVAATAHLAVRAGVRLLATGGLGGVHRGARDTWDESADLWTLARTPAVVVCAGVKSILDVAATVERLESLGVPIVGYRTDELPGFYVRSSGLRLDWRVDSPDELAAVVRAQDELGLGDRALIVANPLEAAAAMDPHVHDRLLAEALDDAERAGVSGKAVTPHLLAHLHAASGGATLSANESVIRGNARLAARLAVRLAAAGPG